VGRAEGAKAGLARRLFGPAASSRRCGPRTVHHDNVMQTGRRELRRATFYRVSSANSLLQPPSFVRSRARDRARRPRSLRFAVAIGGTGHSTMALGRAGRQTSQIASDGVWRGVGDGVSADTSSGSAAVSHASAETPTAARRFVTRPLREHAAVN